MHIQLIEDPILKSQTTDHILRTLPNWFGIEEAIVSYSKSVCDQTFYAIYDQESVIGLASIQTHNPYTAEIHVMAIRQEYHGQGLGTQLIQRIEQDLHQLSYRLLMVKTLGESRPNAEYAKTRHFYRKVGFYPLEEIKEIWGEKNPCLIMVKPIK